METKTKLLPWIVTCVGLRAAAEVSAQPTPTLKRLEISAGRRSLQKNVFFRPGPLDQFCTAWHRHAGRHPGCWGANT